MVKQLVHVVVLYTVDELLGIASLSIKG